MNLYSRFKKSLYQKIYWLILPRSKHHLIPLLPELNFKSDAKDSTIKIIFFRKKELIKTLSFSKLRCLFAEHKSCFLVGTGASIQHVFFRKNANCFFIGMNTAIELSKQQDIHFGLYIMTDPELVKKRFDIVKEVARRKIPCIFNAYVIKAICEKDRELLKKMTIFLVEEMNKRCTEKMLPQKQFLEWLIEQPTIAIHSQLNHLGFCADICKGVFDGGTALFVALQIAYYLGFRNIALLGLDLDEEELQSKEGMRIYLDVIKPSFEIVRGLVNKGLLQVTNLSLESRLPAEVLPKMTFEQYLSR